MWSLGAAAGVSSRARAACPRLARGVRPAAGGATSFCRTNEQNNSYLPLSLPSHLLPLSLPSYLLPCRLPLFQHAPMGWPTPIGHVVLILGHWQLRRV